MEGIIVVFLSMTINHHHIWIILVRNLIIKITKFILMIKWKKSLLI